MSRTEAAQCIGKIFAYLGCGKPELARSWALKLIDWLRTI